MVLFYHFWYGLRDWTRGMDTVLKLRYLLYFEMDTVLKLRYLLFKNWRGLYVKCTLYLRYGESIGERRRTVCLAQAGEWRFNIYLRIRLILGPLVSLGRYRNHARLSHYRWNISVKINECVDPKINKRSPKYFALRKKGAINLIFPTIWKRLGNCGKSFWYT